MSVYTTHYNLDKYESTDRPNLRDQYNSAMDKIDGLLYQQAGAVSSATQAVSTMQQQVSTNTSSITALQQGLATVDQKADDASDAADTAQDAADAAQAAVDSLAARPYRENFRVLEGTTGGRAWSCECHTFQIGTGVGCMQIVEMRGRTIAVTFSEGPAGLFYGNDPVIPTIAYPYAFQRPPATVKNSSESTWILNEGLASETASGSANVMRPAVGTSPDDVYWSIISIGNAATLIS